MPRDPRDEPRVVHDVNGDRYYVTESGKKIRIDDNNDGKSLQRLEREMKRELMNPMGFSGGL